MALPAGVTQLGTFKGAKGDTGSLAFAEAELVPWDEGAQVDMIGPESARGARFKIPMPLPSPEAVNNDDATEALLLTPTKTQAAARAALGQFSANLFGADVAAAWAVNRDAINAAASAAGTFGAGFVKLDPGEYLVKGVQLPHGVKIDLTDVVLKSPDGLAPHVISTTQFDKTGTAAGSIVTVSDATGIAAGSVCAVQYAGGILDTQVTTLVSSITAAETAAITLTAFQGLANAGVLQIGSELIRYTGRSSGVLTGVTRGVHGTTAAAHTTAETIGVARRHYATVLTVVGNIVTLDQPVVLAVTGAQVSFGTVGAGVIGRGMIDGNGVTGGAPTSVYGIWAPLARYCEFDVEMRNTDQGGLMLTRGASDNHVIYAHLHDCGTPEASKGGSFWLYQACKRNRIDQLHITGTVWVAVYLDDRTSTSEDGWDGPNIANEFAWFTADVTTPNQDVSVIDIVSSKGNKFMGGFIRTNGIPLSMRLDSQGVGNAPCDGNVVQNFTFDTSYLGYNLTASGNILANVFVTDRAVQVGQNTGSNQIYAVSQTPGGTPATAFAGKGTTGPGAPGFAFEGDPNTGLYSTAADTVGLAAGGVGAFRAFATELRAFESLIPTVIHSSGFVQLANMGGDAPAAPASRARLFVRSSGAKQQLCVRFPTGAIQILATEP